MMFASQLDTGSTPLLQVDNLCTYFPVKQGLLRHTVGHIRAVDGVSLTVGRSQTLGLVGESGCGKSTLGRTILRLIPATSGSVSFNGQNVFTASRAGLRTLRRQMQIVFQDPAGSLNPRMKVGKIIGEPILVHRLVKGHDLQARVAGLLRRVGLSPDYADRYPHEFSGGQRQRIGIARALALEPRFVVCDEPVSALDVSIQSQILNLLSDLKDDLGLSYLFIAHNLAVVEHFCDRVAVMYLGRIVEVADRHSLYGHPQHPYTVALLSAVPRPDPNRTAKRIMLPSEVPSAMNPPSGCAFYPRCHLTREHAASAALGTARTQQTVQITLQGEPVSVMRKCVEETPPLDAYDEGQGHYAACWYSAAQQHTPHSLNVAGASPTATG